MKVTLFFVVIMNEEYHPVGSVVKKEEAVKKILEMCDAHDIGVDDAIRRSLLLNQQEEKEEEEGTDTTPHPPPRRAFSKRETILGSLVRNHQLERSVESSQENDIIREIRQMIEKGSAGKLPFEVRIMDGSYTVELPAVPPGAEKKGGGGGGGGGGKQSIPTMANSGPFYKLLHQGCRKRETVTKIVMEGINLCLEGGKTYLVLGGPGSGKSTRK